MTDVEHDEVSTADAASKVSYWAVVGGQLRKNRVAMAAWALVRLLVAVAIFAPLLAFNVPLLHADGGATRFPILSSLFDRTLFEGGVDVFFNLLLLCVPVWILVAPVVRGFSRAERLGGARTIVAAILLGIVVVLETWAALGGRLAIRVATLGVVLPGAVAVAYATARPSIRSRRLARIVCFAVVVVGLLAILRFLPTETSPWRVWRGTDAKVEGLAVFPPIPYHPTGVGTHSDDELARARKHPNAENWLGCDINGHDVVSRIVFGTRISVTIGLVGVSIYILIGILLGSLAGYYLGKIDLLIMRLVEVMICFPTMFLLLTIIALFGRSIFLIMLAIGLVGWPGVTRLVRAEFLRQRNLDYVTAASALGLKQRRIIFRHVLPNCLGPVLVSATFGIAGAILTESGLAFLGLGDQTTVSWGQMLTTGRESQEWHLILVPGMAIFFVVTVFNLLGEGLRDALDPKLRR